jgi:ribonuclease P protein component
MPYAYRKSERLRKNNEFTAVMKGKRLSIDGLSLFYTANEKGNFRVGISVGKKLAKAAGRNRLRRQIRSSVMKALEQYSLGYDLVFMARREFLSAGYERIQKAVENVLLRTILRNRQREKVNS